MFLYCKAVGLAFVFCVFGASCKICNLTRSCLVSSQVWNPGLGFTSVVPFLSCYADVISVTNKLLSALVAINQL